MAKATADGVEERPEEAYDAGPFVPPTDRLGELRDAARDCRGCPLHEGTTGVVFGDGPARARIVLVGEQPGDMEDKKGAPFVGPAGRVLRECLEQAGLDVADVYLTNAVKHFKYRREGKRRIHQKPNTAEIEACHPWFAVELMLVDPESVVALGATAARAVLGRSTPIAANAGVELSAAGSQLPVRVTYHPSAALRRQEDSGEVRAAIVATLRSAAGTS